MRYLEQFVYANRFSAPGDMADIPGVLSVCPQYPQKKTTFRDAPVERRQGLMKKLMKILLSRLVLVGV